MRLRLLGAKLVITLAGSAQAFSSAAALTPLGLRLRGAGSPLSWYPQASPEVRAVACAKSAGPDGAARFPCRHSGRASGRTVVTMGRKPGTARSRRHEILPAHACVPESAYAAAERGW